MYANLGNVRSSVRGSALVALHCKAGVKAGLGVGDTAAQLAFLRSLLGIGMMPLFGE